MSEVRAFEFTGHFPSNVEWAQVHSVEARRAGQLNVSPAREDWDFPLRQTKTRNSSSATRSYTGRELS